MSSPLSWAMMLGIAVETTVCSSAATAIARSRAIVTIRRWPSASFLSGGLDPSAISWTSGSNPAMLLELRSIGRQASPWKVTVVILADPPRGRARPIRRIVGQPRNNRGRSRHRMGGQGEVAGTMADEGPSARPLAVNDPATDRAGTGSDLIASLFAEVSGELRRFVLGVVRDPELADDVMQATFVKAIEHGHEARAETSRGWLFRVAFHEALAAKRRQAARDQGHRRLAGFGPTEARTPPRRGPLDPGRDRRGGPQGPRRALPRNRRRVVLARIYEEKTFAQIAGESGLPLGTVLTRMRRALEKMRRTLRPGG